MEIQSMIKNLEGCDKKIIIASYLASHDWLLQKWIDGQPKDKIYKWGSLADTPNAKMELIEKRIDEMDFEEARVCMRMDVLTNYQYNI